jgi:hypothetical protein
VSQDSARSGNSARHVYQAISPEKTYFARSVRLDVQPAFNPPTIALLAEVINSIFNNSSQKRIESARQHAPAFHSFWMFRVNACSRYHPALKEQNSVPTTLASNALRIALIALLKIMLKTSASLVSQDIPGYKKRVLAPSAQKNV